MSYKPIEAYGVIGDMHSVALVGIDGSIDWCCLPNFDSPSVFAAILDDEKGGFFRIAATSDPRLRQMYLPETNILVTRFLCAEGVGEVVDFMPVQRRMHETEHHQIVRVVRSVRGSVPFRLECRPAFDYARGPHEIIVDSRLAVFRGPGIQLALRSPLALTRDGDGAVLDFCLHPDESATFVLQQVDGDLGGVPEDTEKFGQQALHETIAVWRNWVSHCRYRGRWREIVVRSALVLKLLTFQPTGAMVAAPTCSLPEEIGGVRNWDYRYTWIRDAAFTIRAFLRLGYAEEAARFMEWLRQRAPEKKSAAPLQTLYSIGGGHEVAELDLKHLKGYRGSRPVHLGNAASRQLQLDIYGAMTDAIYLYNKHARPISYDLWVDLRRILEWVCANWERKDHSIWEVRSGPRHFVYSKMQCWVALDRGLRIAQKRGLPLDSFRLRQEADRIYETIMQHGWNEERQTFVQSFGSEAIDANSLLLALMFFISPTDPKMIRTVEHIKAELVSDTLVYRYELGKAAGDGLPGHEGTFSICTFWLVEVLARMGRLEEARLIFEKMLTYANHLGLYAEEIGPRGEALGNFPQAFTHLGLISAALDLDRRLDPRR